MKIREIVDAINAKVLQPAAITIWKCIRRALDMMSGVLAFVKEQAVLVTGLVNLKWSGREMMDMKCIICQRQNAR